MPSCFVVSLYPPLLRTITCLLIFLLSLSIPVSSQPKTAKARRPDFSEVRKLIQAQMAARSIPSISVAVARRGEIIWEEAFGFADRENGVPANQETMYYVASLTKTLTGTALALLQQRKKMDFDRPINDYIRPLKISSPIWNPKEATVRRVATHMSGLTTFGRTCYADQRNCHISFEETIGRYGILFWPPGDHFDYSNLGYGILGEAVSRVSGKSYADFMRDEIFLPLGMTHASVGIRPHLEKHAAVRYSPISGRRPTAYSATPGASSVYCNAHGLALFGMFHSSAHRPDQKAILSDASIGMMQHSTVSADFGYRYGLGWWVNEDLNGYRVVLGQGGTDDATAFLQLIPSEGIVVVVLANTGDEFPPKLVDEILSVLLPSYRLKKAAASNENQPPSLDATKPSLSFVGSWEGNVHTYRADLPLTFSISASGDVQAKLGSDLRVPLIRPRFTDRRLTARLTGNLGTHEDTGKEPYDLDVELYLRGDILSGAVTTRPRPGSRYGARLSYWVELKKSKNLTQ